MAQRAEIRGGVAPQVREHLRNLQQEVYRTVAYIPAALVGDATKESPIFATSEAVTVQKVYLVPQALITGQATNNFVAHVVNKGTGGAGVTDLASISFVNGTSAPALTAKDFGAITGGSLAAGSVLSYRRELVGSGLAQPELAIVIEYTIN